MVLAREPATGVEQRPEVLESLLADVPACLLSWAVRTVPRGVPGPTEALDEGSHGTDPLAGVVDPDQVAHRVEPRDVGGVAGGVPRSLSPAPARDAQSIGDVDRPLGLLELWCLAHFFPRCCLRSR